MADKIYACGSCRFPCDAEGMPLSLGYDEATAYLAKHESAIDDGVICPHCHDDESQH